MPQTCNCPKCGDSFTALGKHWRYSPDHRPELTEHQHEILTGLLMSDGLIWKDGSDNPRFEANMIEDEYLYWLDDMFGLLSTGVTLRDNGTNSTNAVYNWTTRNLPELEQYHEWYQSGQKVWPSSISLTPTVLTHLYVGDGHYHVSNYIEIGINNEAQNVQKLDKYFKGTGLPIPKHIESSDVHKLKWTVEESTVLFDYMDSAPPGFNYKFPNS